MLMWALRTYGSLDYLEVNSERLKRVPHSKRAYSVISNSDCLICFLAQMVLKQCNIFIYIYATMSTSSGGNVPLLMPQFITP